MIESLLKLFDGLKNIQEMSRLSLEEFDKLTLNYRNLF